MNPYNDPKIAGSGAGEDVWVLEQFPDGYQGHAVEVGAHDGYYLSNTLLLERKGWTVLCIEPNPVHSEVLRARRQLVLTCAVSDQASDEAKFFYDPGSHMLTYGGLKPELGDAPVAAPPVEAGTVAVKTIDNCLVSANFPKLDCLSIDVDGDESAVLRGADVEKWQPATIVIEYSREGQAIERYLMERGYRCQGLKGYNALFTREPLT